MTAERLAFGGDAIAHHEGLAVFVMLAAPGDRVRARVVERKKKYARAVIEEILTPSPLRREPPCPHFGICGGCQLQHLTYEAQLEAKAGFVRDCLTRIGRIDWPHQIEVISASEFGYRGRAQIKIETALSDGKRNLRIGFNNAGSHAVRDIETCPILMPELDEALGRLRSALKDTGGAEKESGLPIILSEVEMAAGDRGVSFEPEVAGLPSGALKRRVGGVDYKFSPATFFQANPLLLERMIVEAVGNSMGKLAIDLYAGAGLFTLQLARLYTRVIGVESDAGAAGFARDNLKENMISNVEFYNRRVENWLKNFIEKRSESETIDLIALDPPRTGAPEAIEHILRLRPAAITYVSCDPSTLARDLRGLLEGDYKLASIRAFDLFPQTYHIEIVAVLNRS